MILPSKDFWKSKRVLVTGHTGFKGTWLSLYLTEMGAEVHGLALDPVGELSLYSELGLSTRLASDSRIDIRDFEGVERATSRLKPEVTLHLAAQAIVSEGYRSPLDTLAINVMGTANLLEVTRRLGKSRAFVSVATDKVYANDGAGQPFSERDPLGGNDPYSASKAAADIVSQMFATAYLGEIGVAVGIARAGNVIGGGDWSRDRLFPDLARAWSSNQPLRLRFSQATRPWQHVLEPIRGYLLFAEKLVANPKISGPINFGPVAGDSLSVEDVVDIASRSWPENSSWVGKTEKDFGEVKDLSIDSSRAKEVLGIEPVWQSHTAIERTTEWYRGYYSGASAEKLCLDDIQAYEGKE